MKFAVLLALTLHAIAAQPSLTVTGPANVQPGQTVTLNVSLAGSAGQNISGLQWTATPASGGSLASTTLGAAGTATGKGLYCSTNNQTCVEPGLSSSNVITNQPMADGVVATVSLAVAPTATGTIQVPLTGLFGVSTTGLNVAMTGGAAYAIAVLSKCDANQDGKTDFADAVLVINALTGRGTCPLSGGCTLMTLFSVLTAASGGSCPL